MSAGAHPAGASGKVTLGVILMTAFAITGPGIDAFAKAVPHYIPVGQVAAARFAIQALFLLPLAALLGALHRPRLAEVRLHVARAALIVLATGFFFQALRYMPIADAIAIFFVEPFILTLLGAWLLGEDIGPRRIVACTVGFAGALLVIQPSFAEVGWPALLPLGTASCFAFYMILTRRMATAMHPVTLQAYTALAAIALTAPLLWVFDGSGVAPLDPAWPDMRALALLVGVGIMATIAHLFISYALSFAPASTIAPLQYLEIVSATVLGYIFFDDLPDTLTFTGIAVIVASGLYVFTRERSLERRPPPAP